MHEFILHSQITAARQNQVLQVLAGVAAHQPVKFLEQNVIYQQLKNADVAPVSKKGSASQNLQARKLRYQRLVRDVASEDTPGEWKMVNEEVPEASVKDLNARRVLESIINKTESSRFRETDRYK